MQKRAHEITSLEFATTTMILADRLIYYELHRASFWPSLSDNLALLVRKRTFVILLIFVQRFKFLLFSDDLLLQRRDQQQNRIRERQQRHERVEDVHPDSLVWRARLPDEERKLWGGRFWF